MQNLARELLIKQHLLGLHQESFQSIDHMVETGNELVGAMGNDTAPAVFSDKRRPITDFKKQNFAQITNPAIHPGTELDVMNLEMSLGTFKDIDGDKTDKKVIATPIITSETLDVLKQKYDIVEIDCTFDCSGTFESFQQRKEQIIAEAEAAARDGKQILLTNEHADKDKIPFELDMIGPAVHLHLLDKNLRGQTALHARPMEAHTTHDFACLIGSGFNTVNPYLVEHTIAQRHAAGHYGDLAFDKCFENYFKASDFGLLTIMAKKGICAVESYCGAFEFEAFGLGPEYIDEFAPGMPSEIGGFELEDLYDRAVRFHEESLEKIAGKARLPHRGIHTISLTPDGQDHANVGQHIQMLQDATKAGDQKLFEQYAAEKEAYNKANPTQIRDLWDLQYVKSPSEVTEADLEGVQSADEIVKHLGVASMSFGSTSPKQHADTEEGARRAGAKWQSGEGGLPPERKKNEWSGKGIQVASGRFGLDIEVVSYADEIEIKIAQAAKGGEGGQLPGTKVNDEIAAARNCEPGTPLYSMGAHASIKSIEDLAQLVYGLKEANPKARVAVKLVAAAGIDTIAVGAIKNLADRINISGTGGGSGASKQTSQMHTSMPWELYLSKAHKMSIGDGLRERAVLSVDGGMSTPQDVAIAMMLGAEEAYFGKIIMYVLGCKNMGVCNKNICAFGNATMDKKLRENYTGDPKHVASFFEMMAEGLRREMAALGVKSLDELRGRVDLIKHERLKDRNFDFSNQLTPFEGSNTKCELKPGGRNEYKNPQNPKRDSLDEDIFQEHRDAILGPLPWVSKTYLVTNQYRCLGTRISHYLTREFAGAVRENHMVTLNYEGMGVGQQFGFLLAKGITLNLVGSANDGVGEGNSGGIIIVKPKAGTQVFLKSNENAIAGNHTAYGMTDGEIYLAGRTGTNHAYRFSGGIEVNEGVGANAYRFMTGGTGVCLGEFGPGMLSGAGGGTVFIYDPKKELEQKIDPSLRNAICELKDAPAEQQKVVQDAIDKHVNYTSSIWGKSLFKNWTGEALDSFRMVSPGAPRQAPAIEQQNGNVPIPKSDLVLAEVSR